MGRTTLLNYSQKAEYEHKKKLIKQVSTCFAK